MSVPTDDITGEPVAATHERKQRHPLLLWAWSLVHLDFVGVAFGALFFCLSLTPSLLPRDWLFQGLIGGLNAAIGYCIGAFVEKMLRRFVLRRRTWWPPSKRVLYGFKTVIVAVSATACVLMTIPAANWQRQVSAVMGMEGPTTPGYMRTLIIAVLVGGACLGLARVLLDLTHLAFEHQATIGNYATAEQADVTTQLTEHDVTVARWMMDSPPPLT